MYINENVLSAILRHGKNILIQENDLLSGY